MKKNSKRFVLTYNCLLLHIGQVRSFGLKGESKASKILINKGITPESISELLKGFLELFYQLNHLHISSSISLE